MKILFRFLGYFLLYMSCIPCGDATAYNVKADVTISSSSNHPAHNHKSETCTPFCTCSCCATATFYSAFSKIQATKANLKSEKHLLYNIAFDTEAHYTIWQPPRIS